MTTVIRHLVITGRVQGVGYRRFVEEAAGQLGLAGWARNRRDGSVETLVAGPAANVAMFVSRCRVGPSRAKVEEVRAIPHDGPAPGPGFSLLPTG